MDTERTQIPGDADVDAPQIRAGWLPDMTYVVVDTETTGFDAAEDALVEVAAVRFAGGDPVDRYTALCCPGRSIPAVASAVHHLTEKHLWDAPTPASVERELEEFVGESPIVAHNAPFDRGFLPRLQSRPWICTMRFAMHLWTDAPAYKNSVLRYWLGVDREELEGLVPHRAIADALVTGFVFHRQLLAFSSTYPQATLDDVRAFIVSPVAVESLRFGKHRGKKISDIPSDYLNWLVNDTTRPMKERLATTDPDTFAAVQKVLAARAAWR